MSAYRESSASVEEMRAVNDTLWAVGTLLALFWMTSGSLGGAFGTLAWVHLAMLALVAIHEAGHCLSARVVGFKVHGVVIGAGPLLLERTFGGLTLQWRLLPYGGITRTTPQRIDWLRPKVLAVVLAGPASNLLLMLVLMRMGVGPFGGGTTSSVLASIAGANTFTLALNLLPWSFEREGQGMATDGLVVIRTLLASRAQLQEGVLAHYGLEALNAARHHRREEAFAWVERARRLVPSSPFTSAMEASILDATGDVAGAARIWRARLQERLAGAPDEKHVATVAILKNNLAWAAAHLGDPALLDEAERFSKAALAHFPKAPFALGTRGSVLLAQGQVAQALPLLREAYAGGDSPFQRALSACELAVAEARRGQGALAARWLDRARRLDPLCRLLPGAEAALARGPAAVPAAIAEAAPAEPDLSSPPSETVVCGRLRMGAFLSLVALLVPGPGLAMRAGIFMDAGVAMAPIVAVPLLLLCPSAPTAAALGMALMAPAVLALGGLTGGSHDGTASLFAALVAAMGAGFLAVSRWIGGNVPALRFRGATLAGGLLAILGALGLVVLAFGLRGQPTTDHVALALRVAFGFLPLLASGATALVHHPGRGRPVGYALGVVALAWLVITVVYAPHWPVRA
jgi:hypothetical protein